SLDPHRLPDWSCHFLHRGVPGGNDHLDQRSWLRTGDGGADVPDSGHVRAADYDFATGVDLERPLASRQVIPAARFSRGLRHSSKTRGDETMYADRIEAKWIDAFCEIFDRCAVKAGDTAAILSETQSRALNVHLAELALLRMGARPFHIVLPTPRNRHAVPVRSTGASEAIQKLGPAGPALPPARF